MSGAEGEGTVGREGRVAGARREIALFGGSFNPPHLGHVYVVAHVLATERVEAVWLVPTHTHAFGKDLAPFDARVAMCRDVEGLFAGDRVHTSVVEADLVRAGRPNRTAETLEHLYAAHPGHRFALVIGSDLVDQLDSWWRADRVRELARLIVVNRAGYPERGAGPAVPDVSSTWIRSRLRDGQPVDGWVPRTVAARCVREGLYR